jgi:hypothetical protein
MIHNRTVAAGVCLHFGKDFLPYAMSSVEDVVDDYLVMYSPVANHGVYNPSLSCPETCEELQEAAFGAIPYPRTRWFEYGHWRSEGEQFKAAWEHTNADVIVKLDADELWSVGLLADAIAHGIEQQTREIRVPLRHYWRSFYKAFTHDPAAPGRIYLREFETGETTYTPHYERDRIHHMGYSLPVNLMRYKWQTHGHSREFRKDCDWFTDVYEANRQHDCHPIGSDSWMMPDDVVPPAFLLDHPFAKLRVIE